MKEKELKRMLIQKRQNVKNKLNLLKHGEMVQESIFNPITKHLKSIENKLDPSTQKQQQEQQQQQRIKSEAIVKQNVEGKKQRRFNPFAFKFEPDADADGAETPKSTSTPLNEKMPRKLLFNLSTPLSQQKNVEEEYNDENISPGDIKKSIFDEIEQEEREEEGAVGGDEKLSRFEDIAETSYIDYLGQYDPLPRKYINDMYHDTENKEFDHKYGIRHDAKMEKFFIGDSKVEIIGSDIYVKNKRFKGTHGLYELLFKKHPKSFTEEDVKNYKYIVLKTNAHRRHYKSHKQIDGSKMKKYKNIIAPIATGRGMFMEVTGNKIDYVRWNDPNELISRLQLLLASQAAGHTGHTNEINSIIEELREARIIA